MVSGVLSRIVDASLVSLVVSLHAHAQCPCPPLSAATIFNVADNWLGMRTPPSDCRRLLTGNRTGVDGVQALAPALAKLTQLQYLGLKGEVERALSASLLRVCCAVSSECVVNMCFRAASPIGRPRHAVPCCLHPTLPLLTLLVVCDPSCGCGRRLLGRGAVR